EAIHMCSCCFFVFLPSPTMREGAVEWCFPTTDLGLFPVVPKTSFRRTRRCGSWLPPARAGTAIRNPNVGSLGESHVHGDHRPSAGGVQLRGAAAGVGSSTPPYRVPHIPHRHSLHPRATDSTKPNSPRRRERREKKTRAVRVGRSPRIR